LLGDGGPGCSSFRPEQKGFGLVTYQPERLCRTAQQAADFIVSLEAPGRALLLRVHEPTQERALALASRATEHVRHRHKYAHMELPGDRRFYFRTPAALTGRSAGNLEQFHRALHDASLEVLQHHAGKRDFSRWAAQALRDPMLAERLVEIEGSFDTAPDAELETLRGEILDAVEDRYLG